ncbi:hypothetical protein KRR40_08600 [Niabella defluvii]|nr:hypothetical protein KRR40_08600 [Niabella sp. I65]
MAGQSPRPAGEQPGSATAGSLEEQLTITGFRSDDAERTYNNTGNGILFSFDPNTLDADGFKKLGLRDKTIRTLLNYRNKGADSANRKTWVKFMV